MTAEVIELHPGLKELPPDPDSARERLKDVVLAVDEIAREWLNRFPVVIVRRKTIQQGQKNAFDLGRDSVRGLR